jgi:hypothetical protein
MERFEADELAESLRRQLGGRVCGLRLVPRGEGVVLQGDCHSYHVKQLAQHLFLASTCVPPLANEIHVLCRSDLDTPGASKRLAGAGTAETEPGDGEGPF